MTYNTMPKIDNKRVARSRNWRNDIQYNAQNKKDKGTNNDIQSNTQNIKDWTQRASQKLRNVEQFLGSRLVTPVTNPVVSRAWAKDRIVITTFLNLIFIKKIISLRLHFGLILISTLLLFKSRYNLNQIKHILVMDVFFYNALTVIPYHWR